MIPFLLVTIDEIKKIFKGRFSKKQYLFALVWYLFLVVVGYSVYNYTGLLKEKYSGKPFELDFKNYYLLFTIFIYLTLNIINCIFIRIPGDLGDYEVDHDFRNRTGIVIACHNSEDVISNTLTKALLHYPPENIYVADNNKTEQPENNTMKEITESFKCNYRYIPFPNKTNALKIVTNEIYKKYDYLIMLDDDTLFPDKYNIEEKQFLENEKLAGIGFGITADDKTHLTQECIDYEYKLWCQRAYSMSWASSEFIIGIAGMWRSKVFRQIININPTNGKVPYGEDGYNGLLARANNYKMKQDIQNMFRTYTPYNLCYSWSELFCIGNKMSGYGATNIFKQRALRWYRSGAFRLLNELIIAFTYNAGDKEANLLIKILQNIYYRCNVFIKMIIFYWAIMIPVIIYYFRHNFLTLLAFKLCLYTVSVVAQMVNYFKFRNRKDFRFNFYVCFLYPLHATYTAIMMAIAFISSLIYFIPFHMHWSVFHTKFRTPEEDEEEEKTEETEDYGDFYEEYNTDIELVVR